MEPEWIILSDYCLVNGIEPSFILLLKEEGLIETREKDGREYIPVSQLHYLERYSRMYYDLSINVEGIDVIRHMLERMEEMHREIRRLENRLRCFGMDN
ncbi:MAG: chaperone modulator CbpM [Culturomica sp.]|jgi:DNA-binding transcriptional ArsR family regulator|nr:chaperone modulator CbpM [Culturomica sp.]